MSRSWSAFTVGLLTGLLLATAGFAVLAAPRAGGISGEMLVLKLADNHDPSHPTHKSLHIFATRLNELSGGRITVDIYPSSVLGPDMQCLEQLQNGTLAMMKIGAATLETTLHEMAVFSLPYLFTSPEHFWTTLDGPLGDELLALGADKGLRGLSWLDGGSRHFYTVRRPVHGPQDLAGLKLRVQNSPMAMAMVRQLGAAATPIDFGELYTALAQGVVDGAENNPPSFIANKHYEVARYLSLNSHTRIPDLLLMSEQLWQSLGSAERGWIREAAGFAALQQRALWQEATAIALATARQAGVTIIEPDLGPFQAACAPLLEAHAAGPLGSLITRIQEQRP